MSLRIAIACSGLGRIRRGFETFAADLFLQLRKRTDMEVTLFKGGGFRGPDEVVLWNIPRGSKLWSAFPGTVDPYTCEQMTFALSLGRHLKRGNFELIHISDGQLGASLLRLLSEPSRYCRILFSNGGPLAPPDYARFSYVQQVNPVEFQRAVEYGLKPDVMTLLPYGVSTERFRPGSARETRSHLNIPPEKPLLLTVGARGAHKRLRFLIRETATMEETPFLLVVGDELSGRKGNTEANANRLLEDRVRFASFAHAEMPAIYASADLYLHAALYEGCSLALIEAMASGLPIIHHDEPAMNWIVGDAGVAVDMMKGPLFVGRLKELLADRRLRAALSRRARRRAEEIFSWSALLPRYLEMYERALSPDRT